MSGVDVAQAPLFRRDQRGAHRDEALRAKSTQAREDALHNGERIVSAREGSRLWVLKTR